MIQRRWDNIELKDIASQMSIRNHQKSDEHICNEYSPKNFISNDIFMGAKVGVLRRGVMDRDRR